MGIRTLYILQSVDSLSRLSLATPFLPSLNDQSFLAAPALALAKFSHVLVHTSFCQSLSCGH